MKICKCGKSVKTTGDLCEDCFADVSQYNYDKRNYLPKLDEKERRLSNQKSKRPRSDK